jgi:CRISPR/Cas system-associated protein Cas10 (large subunit of type III CRISPR-Cas system)
MSDELEILRTCALLHDIGKLECWANKRVWSEHIRWTYKIVRESLGEKFADIAMRHHTGPSYPRDCHPRTELEKIISVADNLASGADRREEPRKFAPHPRFPIRLSHVLSHGSVVRKSFDEARLAYVSKVLSQEIGKVADLFLKRHREGYLRVFNVLNRSELRDIPADTREPINDVSLWDHMKLTAAFATCIWLDGGYKGDDLSRYDFALLCGDADKVSGYIGVSKRLPDLNARSERIKRATEAAKRLLADLLGPECVIFAAGGGFLAVSPKGMADKVVSEAKKVFEETTGRQVTMTVNYVSANGDEVQKDFGRLWKQAQREMRFRKGKREVLFPEFVEEGIEVCDVCRLRPWVHEDLLKMMRVDAAPRPERLCEVCWRLRREGKGVELDRLRRESNFIALLKADGDDMGKVLGGVAFERLRKANTPSRLSALSGLIHRICEDKLKRIVKEKYNGQCLFAGGDDVLAFVPGEYALEAARSIASRFRKEMADQCTMSVGVAIFRYDLPVYVGLEVAGYLLKKAKECKKNRVAFAIVGGGGVTLDELENSVTPREWNELDELLGIIDFLRLSGAASSKIRKIARIAGDPKRAEEAEIFIKHLMGKQVIDWKEGERFLSFLKTGLLYDAFLVYNAFKET